MQVVNVVMVRENDSYKSPRGLLNVSAKEEYVYKNPQLCFVSLSLHFDKPHFAPSSLFIVYHSSWSHT